MNTGHDGVANCTLGIYRHSIRTVCTSHPSTPTRAQVNLACRIALIIINTRLAREHLTLH